MKKVLTVFMALGLMFGFSGCGGSSTVVDGAKDNSEINTAMVRGKSYIVKNGDEIEKISDDTKLKMESDFNKGITRVTLLSGEAKIIKE